MTGDIKLKIAGCRSEPLNTRDEATPMEDFNTTGPSNNGQQWNAQMITNEDGSLDKNESRLRSKIIVVPNSVPNAFDHPLSVSPKISQVGMSYQQCLRAKPQPAPNTTNQSVPSISMSKTSRLGERLIPRNWHLLNIRPSLWRPRAEPDVWHLEKRELFTCKFIYHQTQHLHFGAVVIVSQNTLEDMLRDVEYVNAFQEHTTCDFYSSDLDVDKQIRNVESYQDHFVDPVSQAVSSILPSSSDNSDRVLLSTERTIQGNADFENVCDYIFQQNQSVQPLEGQPHPPEMPEVPRHTQPHEDQVDSQGPVNTLFELVQKLISCSVCNNTFNRTFVCEDYLIQLNRPIQCACCCVLCSLCYREQKGCRTHKIVSTRAVVNATASILASCPDMEKVGEWDLELDDMDHFKTEADINRHVQQLMTRERTPGIEALRSAFNSLMTANDSMSFKHWLNEAQPEEVAYRYVCIPHIKWFWNHIAAGKWIPGSTEVMIGHDEHLLKLFKVSLGSYRFHWCCFVLKKQIILAMWCTSAPKRGQPKVITLVDSALKTYTESVDFKTMVLYLCRWFTVQYVSPQNRQLKVVLDCKPSEGSSLVHVVASLASKIGMPEVAPGLSQIRPKDDLNYGFNLSRAKDMLTCSSEDIVQGKHINLVEEFNYYHNQGTNTIGLTHMYTNTEQYNSL
ncbi:hypothetical protein DPEC_G00068510 [Dallia pectoralis]|uniref:Uncharacterized protein n=1 Tax=Dallia pectoralis TaxID=75939 RepID=A0ACC2H1H7_DALPE|nr:hypothetical protein DPEC_G00068510 [Dallia pectoralis]